MLTTVRAILANPRYTGHQVWNRQRTDHDLIDPANTTLGHREVMRWNAPADWVISSTPAHPAVVSEADFITAQRLCIRRETVPGRVYLLAGLLCCGVCGRRMESHWIHDRPGYRCRHGHTSAHRSDLGRPSYAYLREDHVLPHLPALRLRLTGQVKNPEPALVGSGRGRALVPPTVAQALAHLRGQGISLTYDPANRTLASELSRTELVEVDTTPVRSILCSLCPRRPAGDAGWYALAAAQCRDAPAAAADTALR